MEDSFSAANLGDLELLYPGILTDAIVKEEEKLARLTLRSESANSGLPNIVLKEDHKSVQHFVARVVRHTKCLIDKIAEAFLSRSTQQTFMDYSFALPKESVETQESPPKRMKLETVNTFVPPRFFEGSDLQNHVDGFEWLKILFENKVAGILGRDSGDNIMQCIAMIAFMIEMKMKGPFLICAPLSTLPKWVTQFRNLAPMIPVVLYHGPKSERLQLRVECDTLFSMTDNEEYEIHAFPVVLTSYEIAIHDTFVFKKRMWKYIITDQNHVNDGIDAAMLRRVPLLASCVQILLTNTPLRRILYEQLLLLSYVLPKSFQECMNSHVNLTSTSAAFFKEIIVGEVKEPDVLATLYAILAAFTLQRIKPDVDFDIPVARAINLTCVPLKPLHLP